MIYYFRNGENAGTENVGLENEGRNCISQNKQSCSLVPALSHPAFSTPCLSGPTFSVFGLPTTFTLHASNCGIRYSSASEINLYTETVNGQNEELHQLQLSNRRTENSRTAAYIGHKIQKLSSSSTSVVFIICIWKLLSQK